MARLAAIDARIAEIDKRLAKDFPDYAALVSPEPLSVEEVQAQLRADEALVLFLDTPEVEADAGGDLHLGRHQDRHALGKERDRHQGASRARRSAPLRLNLDGEWQWSSRNGPAGLREAHLRVIAPRRAA